MNVFGIGVLSKKVAFTDASAQCLVDFALAESAVLRVATVLTSPSDENPIFDFATLFYRPLKMIEWDYFCVTLNILLLLLLFIFYFFYFLGKSCILYL